MPITLVEVKSSDRVETTLLGAPDQRVRIFKAIATGPEALTFKPADALVLDQFPKKGDAHPDDPSLILQSIAGEYDQDSQTVAIYTLTYTWPQTGTISFPTHRHHRVIVRVGSEMRRIFVDRNGNQIGSLTYNAIVLDDGTLVQPRSPNEMFRADAEIGTMVRFPRVQFDIELAGLQPFNPAWTSAVGHVNSEFMPIVSAPPGLVEYVGVDAQHAVDKDGSLKFRVVLHFIAGTIDLVLPGGQVTQVHMDEFFDVRYNKIIDNVVDRTWIGEQIDLNASVVRPVKPRADLNLLIPPEP